MAVKYICPVCGRRFVDWGAEKLGFKCPGEECKGATLILPGSGDEDQEDKPSLKRSRKRKVVAPPVMDIADMDSTFIESDDDVDEEDDEEVELEEDDVVVAKPIDDDTDDDVLLEDDDAVDEDGDDTFVDALDIGGDDIAIDED